MLIVVFTGSKIVGFFFFFLENEVVNGVLFNCEGLFITSSNTSMIVCTKQSGF